MIEYLMVMYFGMAVSVGLTVGFVFAMDAVVSLWRFYAPR